MSKQVLSTGYFYWGIYGYGLLSGAVDRNPTRVDTSDTNNNNEIMPGRKVWTFNVTVIANNIGPVSPDNGDKDIAVSLGEDLYVGTGRILSVSHTGNLDDKIIYNIQGEFLPTSFYTQTESNGLHFVDSNGDNAPDGWGDTGGGTRSITVDQLGKSFNVNGMTTYQISIGKSYLNPAPYMYFIRYRGAGVTGFNLEMGSEVVPLTSGTQWPVWDYDTWITDAGDNVIRVTGSGNGDMRIWSMETGFIWDVLI